MAIEEEIRLFEHRKAQERRNAGAVAAFFAAIGIDLAAAVGASAAERSRTRVRLLRILERERLRGLRRHWSYDLNRHIALKHALDRLDGKQAARTMAGRTSAEPKTERENGGTRKGAAADCYRG